MYLEYVINQERGISDYYFCKKSTSPTNPASIHSHMEFIFVLDGKLSVTLDNITHNLTKGHCMIIMPYEVHSYYTENYSEVFFIACPPDYMTEHKQMLTTMFFNPPTCKFGQCTQGIMEDIVKSDFNDDMKKKSLLYYTLSEFVSSCEIHKKEPFEYDSYRKAIIYISAHYTENITLDTVAESIGITSSHLSRLLNRKGHSSFSDIVNSLRIHNAKRLLEETDITISEAAFDSGYGSIRNFNRIFKSFFGCTPKDIKNEVKGVKENG